MVVMSSISARFSNARRASAGFCTVGAIRSIAVFAVRNSKNEGMILIANSASTTRTNITVISPSRLSPCCLLPIVPSLTERPEAPQLVQIEPDEESLADNFLVRHEPPDAAVARVVPVVAHYEVMTWRHRARQAARIVVAICSERERAPGQDRRRRVLVEQYFMLRAVHRLDEAARELHALARQVVVDLAQRHGRAVDRQPFVAVFHTIARHADHALDVVERRVLGVAEHHHVAALRTADLDQLAVHHRQADAIDVLVHEDEVAHEQRRHHRTRRDLERLDQERAQQEHDQDHREKADRVLDPPRLLQQPGLLLLENARFFFVGLVPQLTLQTRELLAARGQPPAAQRHALDGPHEARDEQQNKQEQGEVQSALILPPAAAPRETPPGGSR